MMMHRNLQIHAFGEGNTRTTAVFTIKYLRTFGFDINNDAFAKQSWYFRNALVRANYNNLSKGIYATTEYIEVLFRNLILSEQNELKNRTMLVQESFPQERQSANVTNEIPLKCIFALWRKWRCAASYGNSPKPHKKRLLCT